jgi:hypothetical protein
MSFGSPSRHDELLQHIGGMLLDAAPAGFRRIDLLVRMTVAVQDAVLTVYLPDGSTTSGRSISSRRGSTGTACRSTGTASSSRSRTRS